MQSQVLYPFEFGSLMGGSQHSLLDLIGRLDRGRYRAVVIGPPVGDLLASASARGALTLAAGTGTTWVFSPRRLPRTLRDAGSAVMRIAGALRSGRVGVIHANNVPSFLYSVAARQWTGSEAAVIWHDRGFGQYPRSLCALVRWIVNRRSNCHLIATTRGCADLWIGRGVDPARVHVIYNGIETGRFVPIPASEAKRALGMDPDRKLVGMVARMSRNKGHGILLRALARVRERHPEAMGLLVGDIGPVADDALYQREIRDLATELGLDGHVIWAGAVANARIPEHLAACEVVTNPSFLEPFGRVIVEAMLMARPVIATRAGGAPELLEDGHSGYLTPPRDDLALAERISALLEDPAHAAAVGEAASQRARTMFALADTAARVEQLYSRLLAGGDSAK